MQSAFSIQEWEELKKYRLTTETQEHSYSPLMITLDNLLQRDCLHDFLHQITAHIGSPTIKVTASMLTKRFAFLVAAQLYAMTVFNKQIRVPLGEMQLITDPNDPLWLPVFYINKAQSTSVTDNRDAWRKDVISSFFAEQLSPIVDNVQKVSKQSHHVLWENISIYIYWLYETVIMATDQEDTKRRAKSDFQYLTEEAPVHVFGACGENPIATHFHAKQFIPHLGEEVRVRTTCCYFYTLTGTKDRCKICPQTCLVPHKIRKGRQVLPSSHVESNDNTILK